MSGVIAGFGDKVRVRVTPETEAAAVAGLQGQVYGETTPSISSVEAIGQMTSDFALNVYFDQRGESLWSAPELVEFIDHGPGTRLKVGKVQVVRQPDGQWLEVNAASGSWLSKLFRRR